MEYRTRFSQADSRKVWEIWNTAQSDPAYRKMLEEMKELEPDYQNLLETLPPEQQDIISDFVSKCEEMSWRILQIACGDMDCGKK